MNLGSQSPNIFSIGWDMNPHVFRKTERFLYERNLKPLSAVRDIIGSQAPKGWHELAKFATSVAECGVWTDGEGLTELEAYPAARRQSESLGSRSKEGNYESALTCALFASMFERNPKLLIPPVHDIPTIEGWIWVPHDVRRPQ
jgi:hypothetical protein